MLELASGTCQVGTSMQSRLAELGSLQEWGVEGGRLPRNVGDVYMGDLSRVPRMLQRCEFGGKQEARAGARGVGSRGDTLGLYLEIGLGDSGAGYLLIHA